MIDEDKKREISATNQLLEVIRGKSEAMEPAVPDVPQELSFEPVPELTEETFGPGEPGRSRTSFSFFAKRAIGLDIGSHTIKCVCIERRGFNRFRLLQAEAIEISTPGTELATESSNGARVGAIKKLMERVRPHRVKVITSIGGVSTAIRQIELPKMTPKELSSSISLWARSYIPFDIKEVQLDYQVLGFDRSSRKIRLILVAVIRDYINQHIKLLHEAEIDPVLVDINPLAVMNAFLFNEEVGHDTCFVVLDIGDRNTTICIYNETGQYFVRNLMISGNDFTRDIQRKLALSYTDAERYKRGEGLPSKKEGSAEPVSLVRPSLDALIKEVRRSLTFYENQARTSGFSRIVLTGGSARMRGLAQYMGSDLGIPVTIFDPFKKIETGGVSLSDHPSQFALAVGLALRNR